VEISLRDRASSLDDVMVAVIDLLICHRGGVLPVRRPMVRQ